jgi:predicted DCC family thiol-disulfide oxidoreductase YuxK
MIDENAGDDESVASDDESTASNTTHTAADGSTPEDTQAVLDALGDQPVVLFDGVCNLCNGVVRTIVPLDPAGRIHFAPLQSAVGTAMQERHGLDSTDLETVVLVEGRKRYTKSTAAIRIAELLGWPYKLARAGRLVPRPLRDRLYDVVAENRYDWFGRREQCLVPDEDVSDRFLG